MHPATVYYASPLAFSGSHDGGTCSGAHVLAHTHTLTHTHTHTHTYMHTHMHMDTYIHMRTHIYTHLFVECR
jgi:hypothetical protein